MNSKFITSCHSFKGSILIGICYQLAHPLPLPQPLIGCTLTTIVNDDGLMDGLENVNDSYVEPSITIQ